MYHVSLILMLSCVALNDGKDVRQSERKFPNGFMFGTASSSYQIEGAWNEDGESENIWDIATHQVPSIVRDGSTGDIANDSYHQYKRDVEMMREVGLDFYRFSLSWTRLLPTSFPDKINEAGVQYYNNLINEMLKYNIEPMVTLFHWDLPQKLQDMGGWTNPEIVNWYSDYARVVFELFGDKIKTWITINEPRETCIMLNKYSGIADYMCAKNLLLAHAKTYHMYNEEFKPSQGGIIGISLGGQWYSPESEKDIQAAADAITFEFKLFADPIFSEKGDFPQMIKDKIAAKSAAQGFFRSRLPELSPEEIAYIRGTSDFFGLNHYTTLIVYRNESVYSLYQAPSNADDMDLVMYQKPEWNVGESGYIKPVPWGFYQILTEMRKSYNNPRVFISENGFATRTGLNDEDRVSFYRQYLSALLDTIDEGSEIQRYAAWSLMDNFEWTEGYVERFGLYEVNYEDPQRTRTPRKSAFVYKEILRSRLLDLSYEPDTSVMTIDEGH